MHCFSSSESSFHSDENLLRRQTLVGCRLLPLSVALKFCPKFLESCGVILNLVMRERTAVATKFAGDRQLCLPFKNSDLNPFRVTISHSTSSRKRENA